MAFFEKQNPYEQQIQKQLSDCLDFINNKYTDLGRYVKLHLFDKIDDPQAQNIISEINGALNQLQELNLQLKTARGLKTCPQCDKDIDINMAFCPFCGAKQFQQNNMFPQQNNGYMQNNNIPQQNYFYGQQMPNYSQPAPVPSVLNNNFVQQPHQSFETPNSNFVQQSQQSFNVQESVFGQQPSQDFAFASESNQQQNYAHEEISDNSMADVPIQDNSVQTDNDFYAEPLIHEENTDAVNEYPVETMSDNSVSAETDNEEFAPQETEKSENQSTLEETAANDKDNDSLDNAKTIYYDKDKFKRIEANAQSEAKETASAAAQVKFENNGEYTSFNQTPIMDSSSNGDHMPQKSKEEILSKAAQIQRNLHKEEENVLYSEPEPQPTGFIYCSQCGSKEDADGRFCSNCGSRL